jgi:hypothetical protein
MCLEDLDHMGQAIAVGDFNHDGFKDIVLGGYNRPPSGEGPFATKAVVVLGTGYSPTSGLPLFRHRLTIKGPQNLDLTGFSLAFIGDISGDHCEELVVGIPRFDGPGMHDSGRVSIINGDPLLIANPPDPDPGPATVSVSDAQDLTFDGTIDEGWFGASLATAQNSSGAFLKDLLVGAPGNGPVDTTSMRGSVYLYASPTLEDAGILAGGAPGVGIGASPLIGGTPGITGSVITGYVATAHRVLSGTFTGDRFGQAVAFVGDLDGVAGQEFLVGAPQYAPESGSFVTTGPGYVRLFRMDSGAPLMQFTGTQGVTAYFHNSPYGGEAFGSSVAGGVQLNPGNDSTPDLLIGAPLFNEPLGSSVLEKAGRVVAFSGQAAGLNSLATPLLVDSGNVTILLGASTGDQFGSSVTGVPDMDADNFDEVLVGAWQVTGRKFCAIPSRPNADAALAGAAYLYFPGIEHPEEPAYKFHGEAFKDHLGRAVAAGHLVATDPPTLFAKPEIILTGVAWTPPEADPNVDPTELGKGYVFVGEMLPPPGS